MSLTCLWVVSRQVASRHVASLHVTSRHVMSCHVLSYPVMSCHVMAWHGMAWHGMAWPTTSRHVPSRPVPSRLMSCHVMSSCQVVSRHLGSEGFLFLSGDLGAGPCLPDALCPWDWRREGSLCRGDSRWACRVRCAVPLGLGWIGAVWWECYVAVPWGLVGGASCPMRCAVGIGRRMCGAAFVIGG